MKKVLFCFAIILPALILAQVTEEWVARYNGPASSGDRAYAIAVDGAGNVYVTGESVGSETSYDYATVKYNPSGTEKWVARYDGPAGYNDWPRAIAIDGTGDVYVTGYSYGSATGKDYATVKYNSSGEEQWVARYDGPGSDEDDANAISIDDAGNVYVTGYSKGEDTYWDYATVKYNSAGEEQWVARYNGPANDTDWASSIALDGASNIHVTGTSKGEDTYWDYATVKYNSNGEELWVARYDGPASGGDGADAIAIDDAGNVYVTGSSFGSGTYYDYATIKYNSSGVEQWVARYDGPGSDEDDANAISIDDAGNVYITGGSVGTGTYDNYDYATVKYDSSGVQQWVARYDGPGSDEDRAYAIAIDGLGNVYVTGTSRSTATYYDYATVKYSSSGVQQWVARYNAAGGSDYAYAIAIDDAGNVYVTGRSIGSGTDHDYATIKYSQGPGVAEAPSDVPGHRLEVAQLTPEPVITYFLPVDTRVSLKVYDVTGQLVRTLVAGSQDAGTHTVTWDARNDSNRQVSAGLYFIFLETRDFRATGKLVVVR